MIVKYPHSILSTPAEEFHFANPPGDPVELSTLLIKIMNDHKGIGLSANQLGIPFRVFVLKGSPENFACFNPSIVYYSPEVESNDEECISYPGVKVKVKRSLSVRLRFQTPSGTLVTQKFDGLTARVIQHEMDHLDGVPFINRANRYHRDKAMKGYAYA
jgi:peptide deformylase